MPSVLGKMCLFAFLLFTANLFRAKEIQSPGHSPLSKPDLVFVQARVISARSAPPFGLLQRFPEGSRLVRLTVDAKSDKATNLTPDFFAASDPQISYDGAKVLFAGKKDRASSWQIWEMNVANLAKRQVTHCSADCVRPAYLPRDEIVYTLVDASSSEIYVSRIDGSMSRPITFGPGDFVVETVLGEGRILVSASAPLDSDAAARRTRELYYLRPDGTGLSSFRCDHRPGVIRREATELDNGTVVFVKTSTASQLGGELAAIRRGALHNSPTGAAADLYSSPRRWESERLIVSRAPRKSRASGDPKFGLYSFDLPSGRVGERLFTDPSLSSFDATPILSRTAPRWYFSTLNPDLRIGYFVCLNSRISMDAPGGRFGPQVAHVRVLSLDSSGAEHSLGEARVESDGSFYIAVPPDRPVRFELLNAGGKTIRAQRSWIWARSGEEHGCIGCHEDKAQAPDNEWPQALRSFDTPIRLGLPTTPAAK